MSSRNRLGRSAGTPGRAFITVIEAYSLIDCHNHANPLPITAYNGFNCCPFYCIAKNAAATNAKIMAIFDDVFLVPLFVLAGELAGVCEGPDGIGKLPLEGAVVGASEGDDAAAVPPPCTIIGDAVSV